MKALVTGGAGFIGSYIVDLLLENGYDVRILDNLEKPVHLLGRPPYLPQDAEFIMADIRSRDAVNKALEGVDVVFHQAAYQGFLPDFSKFFHVNTVGTALIMELIIEKKCPVQKIVLASSQAVYGEGKYMCEECAENPQIQLDAAVHPPPRTLEQLERRDWAVKCPVCRAPMQWLLTDEVQVNPHTQYAMSKYTQEIVAINLGRRHGIPVTALRYSITQGPRQSFFNAYSGILRIFCARLINDQPPVIYEDGKQRRDYVYVGDVAKANLLMLERPETNYQVYNVGSGQPVTVLQYATALADKLGKDIEPEIRGEFRLGDVRHIVSDISKLKSLGWQPTVGLDFILDSYISWIQTQTDVKDYFSEAERQMKAAGAIRKTGM